MNADVNELAMIEDPIEKQRRNKSQKPFVDRQDRQKKPFK